MKKKLISLVLVVAMIICSNNYEIIESSDSVKKCYSEVAEVCLESADGSKLRENRYVDTIQYKKRIGKIVKAKVTKKIPLSVYKGEQNASVDSDEEKVIVENDIEIDMETGTISADLECINEDTDDVLEDTDVAGIKTISKF